jgi:hypothetical protein
MTTSFDHLTLSAYVDGELDPKTMQEVEDFLDRDRDARQFVLDAMRTTVLLRAGSIDVLHEPVPDRLQAIATGPRAFRTFRPEAWFPSIKLAAAFALVIIGVGLGIFLKRGAGWAPQQPFHLLPTTYQQVINRTLENHLSGDALALNLEAEGVRIVITPIKTYRKKDGQYYRGYTMELISGNDRQTFRGMAYRSGRSDWRTTALFVPKT